MSATELEWQYSRNQLRHWVEDGNRYDTEFCLFEIRTDRPFNRVRKPTDTYRLLHKGKLVDVHRKVAALKQSAARIHTPRQEDGR